MCLSVVLVVFLLFIGCELCLVIDVDFDCYLLCIVNV